eukprot:m.173014 g.173014  ORF g.173014 m.173014 type:complete len:685 (+) comp17309_c0_seq2:265-2319(+)
MADDDSFDERSALLGPSAPSNSPPTARRVPSSSLSTGRVNRETSVDESEDAVDLGNDEWLHPTFEASTDLSFFQRVNEGRSHEAFADLWHKIKSRSPYYVPILNWLPKYTWALLWSDLIAGICVSLLIVPQALSYADLANLPPTYGLYSAFVPVLLYACLGTSRQMSVGPEAVVAILTGSALSASEESERVADVAVLTFLVGICSFVLGLLRLGFIDSVLSRPLVEGFILGSATVIMAEQLHSLLGLHIDIEDSAPAVQKLIKVLGHIGETKKEAALFGFLSLAALLCVRLLRKVFKHSMVIQRLPGTLIVVTVSTLISWKLDADLPILGSVDAGFAAPDLPRVTADRFNSLMPTAAVIAMVGFVEATAISRTYANKYNYLVSANRELVAFGCVNLVACFFGSFPVFASLPRSALNDTSGAKTPMVNVVVCLFVTLTIGVLMPLFRCLPRATMGAIVMDAAISLVHFDQARFLFRMRSYKYALLLLLTYVMTITLGVDTGIIVGVSLSVLQVISHTALPRLSILGRQKEGSYVPLAEDPSAVKVDGLLIVKIEQGLHFANSGQLKDLLRRIEQLGDIHAHPSEEPMIPSIRSVIFDFKDVSQMDVCAVQILTEIVSDYLARDIRVCFVRLQAALKPLLVLSGLVDLLRPDSLFNDIESAKMFLEGQALSVNRSTYQTDGSFSLA